MNIYDIDFTKRHPALSGATIGDLISALLSMHNNSSDSAGFSPAQYAAIMAQLESVTTNTASTGNNTGYNATKLLAIEESNAEIAILNNSLVNLLAMWDESPLIHKQGATGIFRRVTTADLNNTVIYASPCKVEEVVVACGSGGVTVKFWNKTTAPVQASDTPQMVYSVPVGTTVIQPRYLNAYSAGLAMSVHVIANMADNNTSATTAASAVIHVKYNY